MIKEFSFSELPVNGAEVFEYCCLFAEQYGEKSDVFVAVDAEYERAASADGTWVSFLNDLRKRLCEKGFEAEVLEQDEIFLEKMKSALLAVSQYSGKTTAELRKSHIPMLKRWEMENMTFTQAGEKP